MSDNLIWLDWPAPVAVRACYTLRHGGFGTPPWHSFNLAEHVGDSPAVVRDNRQSLITGIGSIPVSWLQQVHGHIVVPAQTETTAEADASYTRQPRLACCVMTADCLPVFFCEEAGQQVAVAHAGWRGLARGILQNTVATFPDPQKVMACFGPAISQRAFETGSEVRDAFLSLPQAQAAELDVAFTGARQPGKWMVDLYELARRLLQQSGIRRIYGGDRCTFSEPGHFFSHRRDGQTGRMANLIWINP